MTSPHLAVKIDPSDAGPHHRDSSFDFDAEHGTAKSAPLTAISTPTAEFSFGRSGNGDNDDHKHAGEMVLDMALDELRRDTRRTAGLPPFPPSSTNPSRNSSSAPSPTRPYGEALRVSFKGQDTYHNRRSTDYNDLGELTSSSDSDNGEETAADGVETIADDRRISGGLHSRRFRSYRESAEVVRCTSNAAYDRVPTMTRTKTTRSRLMDPELKSARYTTPSGPLRSGFLGKSNDGDDDEDDPFFEDDFPDDYKKEALSVWVMMEWICLITIITVLLCSLLIPDLRDKTLWKLKLWKWDVMVLVLICGRLVSGWLIKFMVFFSERNFMLRKRVLYFVYGLRNAVRNCIWLGLVLLIWHLLFDSRVEDETRADFLHYVTKILVCFLVGAFLWLLKTLLVKVMASKFHVNAFFDRIQETLFNQFVIEALSGPPLFDGEMSVVDIQRRAGSVLHRSQSGSSSLSAKINVSGQLRQSGNLGKKQENGGNQGITIDNLHKLNQKNVSAWNMKRLMKIVRRGSLTTLDEQIGGGDESTGQIRSEVEAKAAARKIFRNVAMPGSRFIYMEDLLRFMQEDEATKTLHLFEGAVETDRISKSSLKNWVVNAFRERRALALTINDTKTAVNKLHQIVNVIVSIIISLICLILLDIATTQMFILVSSQLLLATFVFGNFCKNVFESIIFLFVIHPYDVGDRCEIDGVQMVVEEMNILTTVFLRYDNQKIVFPNSVLLTKPIGNYYRSPDMGDAVEFCCHILTPPDKISLARQRILSYIENKKEHWHPNPMIILKDVESFERLKIAIWLQHKMNHQDMGERWGRRALLVEECVKIFRELDIEYRVLPVNINVRTMPQLPNWGNIASPSPVMNSPEKGSREVVHR